MGAPKLDFPSSTIQIELNEKDFQYFSRLIYQLAGINLPYNSKNISLVQNRLSRLLRRYKLSNFTELVQLLEKSTLSLTEEFISCLTTNKTHFFREESHFQFLKSKLQKHFANHHELRIWCAASSTGQEPYTLAIVLSEALTATQLSSSKILATDIDLEILKKANTGQYSESEMDGLSLELKQKYFVKEFSSKKFVVNKTLRSLVDFGKFNLITGNYKFAKPFDFIFCRNVLIYFDRPTTKKVLENLCSCLRMGGYLIIGHSESGTQTIPTLTSVAQAVYRKDGHCL
jgi:chemotaxis protein methyltransferase CheR